MEYAIKAAGQSRLLLVEQFFLLSIENRDGFLRSPLFCICGTALADLAVQGYVSIFENKAEPVCSRIQPLSPTCPGHSCMKQAFDNVQRDPNHNTGDHVFRGSISRAGRQVQSALEESLSRRGIEQKEFKKRWWLRPRYGLLKLQLRRQMEARIEAIFTGAKGDTESLILLASIEDYQIGRASCRER